MRGATRATAGRGPFAVALPGLVALVAFVALAALALCGAAPARRPAPKPHAAAPAPVEVAAPVRAAPVVDPADRALYDALCSQALAAFDSVRGGYARRDGTPCEPAIELALARGSDGDALALARARQTLGSMHALLDTVGGGFVTTPADRDPRRASFDKRTSVNVRRLEVLVLAHPLVPREETDPDAARVVDYAQRVLVDPRGGFVIGQGGSRDLEPESNGLALQAWWRWGVLGADPRARDFAWRSLDRVWNECREPELGMVRRNTWGQIQEPSLMIDQVEAGRAFLFAWRAAGRDTDLARARLLATHLRDRFADARRGGFRYEYAYERFGHARRVSRPYDDNARAARFLAELGAATGDTAWTALARGTWQAFVKPQEKPKLEAAEWALAVRATWADGLPGRSRWGVPDAKPGPSRPAKGRPAVRRRGRG